MKLIQIIMPLATAALAMAREEQVKFTEDGLANVMKVQAFDPTGDEVAAAKQVADFLERNPNIKKSAEEVLKDPKKQKAVAKGVELLGMVLSEAQNSKEDSRAKRYRAKIQSLEYVYNNPDFFELVQSVAMNIIKNNPTLLDDFFATLGRLVKDHPELFGKLRKAIMDFSHKDKEVYKKGFTLLLKASLSNVDFSSEAAIHILELDELACANSPKSEDGNQVFSVNPIPSSGPPQIKPDQLKVEAVHPEAQGSNYAGTDENAPKDPDYENQNYDDLDSDSYDSDTQEPDQTEPQAPAESNNHDSKQDEYNPEPEQKKYEKEEPTLNPTVPDEKKIYPEAINDPSNSEGGLDSDEPQELAYTRPSTTTS